MVHQHGEMLSAQDRANATQRYAMVVLAFALKAPWDLEVGFEECESRGVICNENFIVCEIHMVKLWLTGSIPNNIALLTGLSAIDFWNNSLTGTVPWDLMMFQMTAMTRFKINNNRFSGSLPSPQPDTWLEMQSFLVSQNCFQGTISSNFVHWSNLQELNLGQNQLSGTIPVL
jgi:hypothetical protein